MRSEFNDTSQKHVQQDERQEKNNMVPKSVFNHPLSLSLLHISPEGSQRLLFGAFKGHAGMMKREGQEIINTARMKEEEGKEFCNKHFHPSFLDIQGCGRRSSILDFKSCCCCIMTGSAFRSCSNYTCPPACGSTNVIYRVRIKLLGLLTVSLCVCA